MTSVADEATSVAAASPPIARCLRAITTSRRTAAPPECR